MSTCWRDRAAVAVLTAISALAAAIGAGGSIAPPAAMAVTEATRATARPNAAAANAAQFANADRDAWLLEAMEGAQREVSEAAVLRERLEAARPEPGWAGRLAPLAGMLQALAVAVAKPSVLIPATFIAVIAGGLPFALRMRRRAASWARSDRKAESRPAVSAAEQPAARAQRPADARAARPAEHLPSFASAARRASSGAAARPAVREAAGETNIWGRILRLSATGMPGDEIARTLGASLDDVHLVLGLERKRVELAGALAGSQTGRDALGTPA